MKILQVWYCPKHLIQTSCCFSRNSSTINTPQKHVKTFHISVPGPHSSSVLNTEIRPIHFLVSLCYSECVHYAYLPVRFPAWGKFLWWASSLSSPLLPLLFLFLPPLPPPPQVSPECRSPLAPAPSSAPPAGRGDVGPAEWDSLLRGRSCHSSHWPAAAFGTASSCAQWREGCRPAGRSAGTGRMSAGRGRREVQVAGRGPGWAPARGEVGQATVGVRSRRAGCHLGARSLPSHKKNRRDMSDDLTCTLFSLHIFWLSGLRVTCVGNDTGQNTEGAVFPFLFTWITVWLLCCHAVSKANTEVEPTTEMIRQ